MTTLITIITKSSILKWAFGYSFTLPILALVEGQVTNEDFFNKILNAVPSKVVVILGIIYGIAIVTKQLSNTWSHHEINRINVKREREHLEQEEIETEKQRKDLNYENN